MSDIVEWTLTAGIIVGWVALIWRISDPLGELLKAWAADIEGRRNEERAWTDGYEQGVEDGFSEGMEDAQVIQRIQADPEADGWPRIVADSSHLAKEGE